MNHSSTCGGYAISLSFILISSTIGVLMLPAAAAAPIDASCENSLGPGRLLVSAPPTNSKGPDDITRMAVRGLDGGKELIWTEFQNGLQADGSPGTPGGPTESTIAGFDPTTGMIVRVIPVPGHVDGLTADPSRHVLIATNNEDVHSAFFLIYPETGKVVSYKFSPDPAVSGAGGTDSIAILHGRIYVSHSNPLDTTQPTVYEVSLNEQTLTANLRSVFYDNSSAISINSRKSVQLGLTDPDTNFVMPEASPMFRGDLATISQADAEIVFATHLTRDPRLWVLNVTDNIPGNVPPIDGLAVATSNNGSLYVVDAAAGTIQIFSTSGCPKGTVFVGEPHDNGNPLVGTLNLFTGKITPFGNHFQSPKGLLFVPNDNMGCSEDQGCGGD